MSPCHDVAASTLVDVVHAAWPMLDSIEEL